jgi:hypothetical protein
MKHVFKVGDKVRFKPDAESIRGNRGQYWWTSELNKFLDAILTVKHSSFNMSWDCIILELEEIPGYGMLEAQVEYPGPLTKVQLPSDTEEVFTERYVV